MIRAEVADVNADIAALTLTTGKTMRANEWKGATLTLDGVTFRTYEVVSNTTAGVLTVKTGSNMDADFGASVDPDYTLVLPFHTVPTTGTDKGLRAEIIPADVDDSGYFGLVVWIDDARMKTYPRLSMDPTSEYYVERIINDDESNDWVEAEDLLTAGTVMSGALVPSPLYGQLNSLTATKATFNPIQVVSVSSASVRVVGVVWPASPTPVPHRLTFTWDVVAHEYAVVASAIRHPEIDISNLPVFAVGAGAQYHQSQTPESAYTIGLVVDHYAEPAASSTIVVDVLPIPDAAGYVVPDSTAPLKKFQITSRDHNSVTINAGDLTTVGTAPALATVTGTVAGPYAIVAGVNDAFDFSISNREAIVAPPAPVLAPGPARTAAQVAADINTAFDSVYGAGVLNPASVYTDALGATYVRLTGVWHEGGGPGSVVTIAAIANDCYATLGAGAGGFVAGSTYGTPGKLALLEVQQPCWGGYDGAAPPDSAYQAALATDRFGPLYWTQGGGYGAIQLAIPDKTTTAIQQAAEATAAALNLFFHVLVPNTNNTSQAIRDYVNTTVGRSDFAGVFVPSFVTILDPDKTAKQIDVPNTGMVMGRIAKLARNSRHYVDPAAGIDKGVDFPLIVTLPIDETNFDLEVLTPNGINSIVKRRGRYIPWGCRTIGNSKTFRWLTHRLQTSQIEHDLQDNMDLFVFRLNDPSLWAELSVITTEYMLPIYRAGAFKGRTPFEAFQIKADDENNPVSEQEAGNVHLDLGFIMKDPAERVVIGVYPNQIVETAQ